jgi:hypothetical protein
MKNHTIQMENYAIQMENYRIQMENVEYKSKIIQLQMENYTIQMENYIIQIKKIRYCNVWKAIISYHCLCFCYHCTIFTQVSVSDSFKNFKLTQTECLHYVYQLTVSWRRLTTEELGRCIGMLDAGYSRQPERYKQGLEPTANFRYSSSQT